MNDRESCAAPSTALMLSRRQFIEGASATGGVVALGLATGMPARADVPATTATALTPDELATLRAILARLFPQDDLGPGAVEAGVDVYIDRSLAGAYATSLPLYQHNLAAIDNAAITMGARSFASLATQQQDEVLRQIEAGKAPGEANPATLAQFFQLLLMHMREGLFGDPMYGGNKALAGWKLIGYPGIKLSWTAQDQSISAHVPPTGMSAQTYGGAPYHGPIPEI